MKKTTAFKFDHINKTIVGTKSAIERANVLGSDEYKALSSAATTQRYIGIEPQRIEEAIQNHAQLI